MNASLEFYTATDIQTAIHTPEDGAEPLVLIFTHIEDQEVPVMAGLNKEQIDGLIANLTAQREKLGGE